ncbi:MAG: hypothetical protein LUQ70_00480 [Methanobacteriaceae archaeon]|nr:hypothetical protein [Methanobacteriaceae archaeon]
MKCIIRARSLVNPTEDLQKVIKSLSNVFDYDEIELGEGYVEISGEISCLLPLKEYLEKGRIRDTARKIMLKGKSSGEITFNLSKQAAYVGKINLIENELSSLGEIEVTITAKNTDEVVDWLCKKEED